MSLVDGSDEIRTPMNAVLGAARLLATTHLSEEQQQYLSMINSSGKLLLTIIGDILDYQKLESGNFVYDIHEYSLLDCMETAIHMFDGMAREQGLDLCYEMDTTLPNLVWGDSTRLQQIVINLVSNAIK